MAQFPSALQVPRLIRILERDCRGIKHADFNPDLPCLFFSEAKYWSNHGYPDLFCNYSNFNPDHFILFGQNTLRYKCFTLTSQELSNPIFPCPLRHFAMERCYLQLWWYFFTKCEQEKKSLLYLKVKDGTFKCVTTALLHKQKSDTSQDALKMSQNISIVPVKPDVGHAKGKNWPFGRENYLKK